MVYALIKKIKEYFLDETYSYRDRAFTLVIAYTMSTLVLSLPCFMLVGSIKDTILVVGSSALICLIFLFAVHRGRLTDDLAVGFCYYTNIVCLPLCFVFGGGIEGGMEFLFLPATIDAFLLLTGTLRIVSLLIFSFWYILIIIFGRTNYISIRNVPTGPYEVFSLIMTMLFSVLITLVVVKYQSVLVRNERNKVKKAMEDYDGGARTKSRFLANMSHELRTPMNAIIGMADLMEKEDVEGAASEEIHVVKSTAESLLMTVNDILIFSKLESGKPDMVYEQFSLDRLLSEIISQAARTAEENNVELETDLDPMIPNVLYGDEQKIRQLLENLLFNAVESTESGRVTFSLSGRKNREGSKVTFYGRITDTGEGMSSEDLENIYTSYETYDSKKDSNIKKLGLKLTICKGILEMMNGDLEYESILNVGSCADFHFDSFVADTEKLVDTSVMGTSRVLVAGRSAYLRRVWGKRLNVFRTIVDYASNAEEFKNCCAENVYAYFFMGDDMFYDLQHLIPRDAYEKTYVITGFDHKYGDFGKCRIIRKPVNTLNLGDIFCDRWNEQEYEELAERRSFTCADVKVLVVDDNNVNLLVAKNLLEKYGITVLTAQNGFEALKTQGKDIVDLVLLDQMMPGIGGVETMREMRLSRHFSRTPIICMTADIGENVKKELIDAGFDDYLSKPVKAKQLENILLEFLPNNRIVFGENEPGVNTETDGQNEEPFVKEIPESKPEIKDASDNKQQEAVGTGSEFKVNIDMESGMAIVGGDRDIYHTILNVYYGEGLEKLEAIPKEYYEDNDIKLFAVDAHSVKGSSANIGAKELSEMFKALEFAGKGEDRKFIEENLESTMEALRLTLEYIKDYLIQNNAFEGQDEA